MEQFAIDRDKAFTNFVHTDDFAYIKSYADKYKLSIGYDSAVARAAVYKAVQECTHIDKETKAIAREKCIALGFKPTMWE